MASVRLEHICKVYPGGVEAVADFSLVIEDGEFLVIVGPSGCGKSTVLRMIAGVEDITGGTIHIGDRLVNDLPPSDRDIAMVFQNYALYPHMTVYGNMAFGLKMRGMPKQAIRERVTAVAEQLDMAELLGRKPLELSGGQLQRVALGRAMVRSPVVFLLDEPLSNLDAALRASMRTEILRLHQRLGTTFVYVTHDQTEAMTMADRIVVMKDGLIQQVAPPREIYRHPRNLFVASFIGSPGINLLTALPERGGQGCCIQVAGHRLVLPGLYTEALSGYWGREMILGIRPEDILLCKADAPGAIRAKTEGFEMLGAESYLHLLLGGEPVTVRTAPVNFATGEDIYVGLPAAAIHLFDKDTGETVVCRPNDSCVTANLDLP